MLCCQPHTLHSGLMTFPHTSFISLKFPLSVPGCGLGIPLKFLEQDSNKAFNCSPVYCSVGGYLGLLDKLYLWAGSERHIVMVGGNCFLPNLAGLDFSTYNLLISPGREGHTRDF